MMTLVMAISLLGMGATAGLVLKYRVAGLPPEQMLQHFFAGLLLNWVYLQGYGNVLRLLYGFDVDIDAFQPWLMLINRCILSANCCLLYGRWWWATRHETHHDT